MSRTDETNRGAPNDRANKNEWPGIDSRYRLIVVAALRTKQLQHGAAPRIAVNPLKSRNTSIALEEAKRGLVPFKITDKERSDDGVDASLVVAND